MRLKRGKYRVSGTGSLVQAGLGGVAANDIHATFDFGGYDEVRAMLRPHMPFAARLARVLQHRANAIRAKSIDATLIQVSHLQAEECREHPDLRGLDIAGVADSDIWRATVRYGCRGAQEPWHVEWDLGLEGDDEWEDDQGP